MPVTTPPKLHAVFDITASTNDRFRVDTPTVDFDVQLSAGTGETAGYYIRAHTFGPEGIPAGRSTIAALAGAGAQLVEEIQQRVRNAAAAAGNANFAGFTCVVSDTGIVTMANAAETFAIAEHSGGGTAWANASTGLAQILGYTGVLGAANTQTAPNQHRYGWYPNVPPANYQGVSDRPDVASSPNVRVQRAPPGLVTTRSAVGPVYDRTYVFNWLDRERAFIEASGFVNQSLEQFWLDALRTGARVRYYQDRTVQTAPGGGAPWGYVAAQAIAEGGPSIETQDVDGVDTLWNVEIPLHRFVASP